MRTHPLLSLFTASLIAFAPVHALAQDREDSVSVRERPRPEYDPLGLRLGGFNLNAQLDFGVASTDNLFAQDDAFAEEDIIYTVAPRARLSSNWSRHALTVEAGAESRSHADFDSEDAETWYMRGVGRLDVGSSSSLTGVAGIAHEVESRADPDAAATADPVEYDRSNVSLTAQHTFNRFRVSAEIGQSEYDFEAAQNARDSEETVLRGRIDAEITPRLGALLEVSTDERDYDNSPGNSSEGNTILVGATINFTDLMRGEISVGQFERDYDNPLLGSTDGLAVQGNLEWYITRLTTLTFNAHRNAEDVVGGNSLLPYVENQFGARVDHELLRNVIVGGGFASGRREYDAVDREDEFFYGNIGVDYLLNRRVAVFARYQYDQVDSSGVDAYRDYEQNKFSLGLSLRL